MAIIIVVVIVIAGVSGGLGVYFTTQKPAAPAPAPALEPTPPPVEELKVLFATAQPANNFWCMHQVTLARISLNNYADVHGVNIDYREAYDIKPSDAPYILKQFADDGYKLQILTEGLAPLMEQLGEENPDTEFLCVYYPPPYTTPNVGGYNDRNDQSYYLAGMLAGMMTETNKIGYVAAFDIPASAYKYHAFLLGVETVNPDAEVIYTFTNDGNDVSKGATAANTLIGMGADIITGYGNSMMEGAVVESARQGVYSIAYIADLSYMSPDYIAGSVYWNAGTFYERVIQDYRTTGTSGKWYDLSIDEGGQDLVLNQNLVESGVITSDMISQIDQAKQALASGDITGWPAYGVVTFN